MTQLKLGTQLHGGDYTIYNVLGQGGFGITYLAHRRNKSVVCIKEFFMKSLNSRDESEDSVVCTAAASDMVDRYKQKFIKEAKQLKSLNHPNIVKVYDVFEENGTAYYVMENIEGGSLKHLLNLAGRLNEEKASDYIHQIAEALSYLHHNHMMHLDIKPDNILLRPQGGVVLIDFGTSKGYDSEGSATSTTPVGLSKGYAPIEQYTIGGTQRFSPATDIYALGATLYRMLTGETPEESVERLEEGHDILPLPAGLKPTTVRAVNAALMLQRAKRPQSVEEFLELLDGKDKQSLEDKEGTLTLDDENVQKKLKDQKVIILDDDDDEYNYMSAKTPDDVNYSEPIPYVPNRHRRTRQEDIPTDPVDIDKPHVAEKPMVQPKGIRKFFTTDSVANGRQLFFAGLLFFIVMIIVIIIMSDVSNVNHLNFNHTL